MDIIRENMRLDDNSTTKGKSQNGRESFRD
jgi:hypothetical protein